MGRLILILLVALGLGLTFPESREVILEHAQPLIDPGRRWMTSQELGQIVADLEVHQETRDGLPLARGAFDEWMDGRYQQESSREDAWGTRYRLELRGESFRVIAAGPDGEFGTDDDMWREGARFR